jgi:hypothetical protein
VACGKGGEPDTPGDLPENGLHRDGSLAKDTTWEVPARNGYEELLHHLDSTGHFRGGRVTCGPNGPESPVSRPLVSMASTCGQCSSSL